jgi:hypothetical protein
MPIGNSRNWLIGSLFILAITVIAARSWAADEIPNGDLIPKAAPENSTLGIQDESKSLGVQDESKSLSTPSTATTPSAEGEECGSLCGMPLCSPPGRFWLRTDAMMWWTNGIHLPPLVTSNSTGNSAAIGQPGTQVLFGSPTYLNEAQNTYLLGGRGGARITLGAWLDRCHRWGIEADWFTIAGASVDYSNFSNGNPATGRPFFSVEPTAVAPTPPNTTTSGGPPTGETVEIVAENSTVGNVTTSISGTVAAHDGDSFDAAGFLVRYNLCCCGCGSCGENGDACNLGDCCDLNMNYCRTDFLFGYRHYSLRDNLTITESLDNRSTGFNFHTDIADNFSTHNDFNGADIGLSTELRRGRWSLNILSKMAIGNNRQTTDINGTTVVSQLNGPPNPTFFPVGIYAVGTNSGTYARDEFVVIPQLGLELGYQISCHTRAYLGYNLLYWGDVMRAGNQIDRNIDPRNWASAPDAANALPFPQFPDRQSSFWAQGINLGAEVRF